MIAAALSKWTTSFTSSKVGRSAPSPCASAVGSAELPSLILDRHAVFRRDASTTALDGRPKSPEKTQLRGCTCTQLRQAGSASRSDTRASWLLRHAQAIQVETSKMQCKRSHAACSTSRWLLPAPVVFTSSALAAAEKHGTACSRSSIPEMASHFLSRVVINLSDAGLNSARPEFPISSSQPCGASS